MIFKGKLISNFLVEYSRASSASESPFHYRVCSWSGGLSFK
jgi:hypothetical protein